MRKFKSPIKAYQEGHFDTVSRPHSPSPKRKDYRKASQTKSDKVSRCTYIHPDTNRRCKNKLGPYPQYCKLHTLAIENLYIDKSNIEKGGNGLFVGPYGFKKGDIIGLYSYPWNYVKAETLEKRCNNNNNCYSYALCDDGTDNCWDGLDIRSTLMRNINDAHKSGFHNNCEFVSKKGKVYVAATRNLKPKTELFVNYGPSYWGTRD